MIQRILFALGLSLFLHQFSVQAYGVNDFDDGLLPMEVVDHLSQRLGVNLYIGNSSEVTTRHEFAALTYDITPEFSLNIGTSVSQPESFHYIDLSMHNPWTIMSWQSSMELGVGRYNANDDALEKRLSQSISLGYGIDDIFSLHIMLKRFSKALFDFDNADNLFAMGVGMRI